MLKTTKVAITQIAEFDSVEQVWEVHCPIKRNFKVPLEAGEKSWAVAAQFRKWCEENGISFRVIGDGDIEGHFYVEGLRMI